MSPPQPNPQPTKTIPPFEADGAEGAKFHCLAFAPVKYHRTKPPALPAALGIYFSTHKDFTKFSQHCFGADAQLLSYARGDDNRDTLEFTFLSTHLDSSIHPAMWRLFPRAKIPPTFKSTPYEQARHELCLLLFHFRSCEMAVRLTADLPHNPLMTCDESFPRVSIGDFKEDDQELERAIIKAYR